MIRLKYEKDRFTPNRIAFVEFKTATVYIEGKMCLGATWIGPVSNLSSKFTIVSRDDHLTKKQYLENNNVEKSMLDLFQEKLDESSMSIGFPRGYKKANKDNLYAEKICIICNDEEDTFQPNTQWLAYDKYMPYHYDCGKNVLFKDERFTPEGFSVIVKGLSDYLRKKTGFESVDIFNYQENLEKKGWVKVTYLYKNGEKIEN